MKGLSHRRREYLDPISSVALHMRSERSVQQAQRISLSNQLSFLAHAQRKVCPTGAENIFNPFEGRGFAHAQSSESSSDFTSVLISISGITNYYCQQCGNGKRI